MTVFLLVRHAAHELVERVLVGRMGISLSELGRRQSVALYDRLRGFSIAAVQSSPQPRALETADIIAGDRRSSVDVCEALDELDFGLWAGCTFAELANQPRWTDWNRARGRTRPPGGESMREVQERVISHLQRMHETSPQGCVVIVTHAEVIRAAVLHAMSLSLEEWWRIEVPVASVTRFEVLSLTRGIVTLNVGVAAA